MDRGLMWSVGNIGKKEDTFAYNLVFFSYTSYALLYYVNVK